ncbi:unnamed protein product [Strongylus vulgaris]|uniref:Uncharacterized protein n=1 Tax=Strongylus vulgaris TaxID=40348 RepID=A0A3P7IVW8_STRVU|nr:unnamed protein product [Strongylus vulgaris]
MPRTRNLRGISKATKDLVKRRKALMLDLTVSHLERPVAIALAEHLQEDLRKYRQSKVLEAVQGRRSLKKYRRDLLVYRVPLTIIINEDGTRTSSQQKLEIDHEKNQYQSLPLINTHVTLHHEGSHVPGLEHILADLLRAEGHRLHEILAEHPTSYLQKERILNQRTP